MVVIPNILTWPLVLVIEVINAYVLSIGARLLLEQLQSTRSSTFGLALRQITDPVHQTVNRWLFRVRKRPVPAWLPWLIVILTAVLARHVLVRILLAGTQ